MNKQGNTDNLQLGELLVSRRLVSRAQLDRAMSQQRQSRGSRLGQILVMHGALTNRQLRKVLSRQSILRKVACVIALIMAPWQTVMAKEVTADFIAWDHAYGVDALKFGGDIANDESRYKHYRPVTVSVQDFKSLYSMLARRDQPIRLMGLVEEPIIQNLRYNFEVNTQGGMRMNLEYRF